jgi:polysaccharide biosynthesis/export protein
MSVRVLAAAMAMMLAAACGGPKPLGGSSAITVIEATELPAPNGGRVGDADLRFKVGSNDRLMVDVAGFDELRAREFVTSSDGELSLPLAGRISADGLTLGELERKLVERLRANFVRDPKVSVNVIEARSRRVTVDGSVKEPGSFPVLGRMTLMQSVASAKGVTEFAKLDDVVIFRTVGDKRMVALFNLGAIRRGMYEDPVVFPGDIVVVGESSGRRLFQNLVQASALISTPLVAILNSN